MARTAPDRRRRSAGACRAAFSDWIAPAALVRDTWPAPYDVPEWSHHNRNRIGSTSDHTTRRNAIPSKAALRWAVVQAEFTGGAVEAGFAWQNPYYGYGCRPADVEPFDFEEKLRVCGTPVKRGWCSGRLCPLGNSAWKRIAMEPTCGRRARA